MEAQIPGAPIGCSFPEGTCLIGGRCLVPGEPFSADDQCRFCGGGGSGTWSFRPAGVPFLDSSMTARCCDGAGHLTACVI